MKFLSRIEEILLLSIFKLKDKAYGIAIREQVEKDTNVTWLSGAIYAPLNRLKKNGYVSAVQADQVAELGGRPRIYYTLTDLGQEKLISIQQISRGMWKNVPNLQNEF